MTVKSYDLSQFRSELKESLTDHGVSASETNKIANDFDIRINRWMKGQNIDPVQFNELISKKSEGKSKSAGQSES